MSEWRAVIFDLDDTLYPEAQFVRSGLLAVSRAVEADLGIPQPIVWEELTALLPTAPQGKLLNVWMEQRQVEAPHQLARWVHVYRGHSPELQLHAGLRQILVRLRERRRLGLVSDGWLAVQQRKFRALVVDDLFQAVVFSDQWGPAFWKPHPRPFEAVLAGLQCDAAEAVYIGDNPTKDFIGCRRLGMSTIRLRMPGGVYWDTVPPTPDHAADCTVSSVVELGEQLGIDAG